MPESTDPFTWKGEYDFRLSGSGLHEDTLRIKSSARKQEQLLKLVLPTLCITYADAKFQDDIGGEQENFPASQAYGSAHFDPPIEILGEEKIEMFTYIRGAHRVEIGPKRTVIEFPSWKDLVIPRLRLDRVKPVDARLHVPETHIQVEKPLQITALQYADGRHVGGVRMEKRHPEWKPSLEEERHSLWIRVIDGRSLQPLPKVMVDVLRWREREKSGRFLLEDRLHTDGSGCIEIQDLPSGDLEAYVVRHHGWRAVVRCVRPLAGQIVRLHMRAWPLHREKVRFEWKDTDRLDVIARRAGVSVDDLASLNRLRTAKGPAPGARINLPLYAATYQLEPWDDLDWVASAFGYEGVQELAEANGLKEAADLAHLHDIRLPDWHFLYAKDGDTFEGIDRSFGLPPGSTIPVGRVFHPNPKSPYPGETVAIPTELFADRLRRR